MRNTRKFGQILKSKKRLRPTLRNGRGSRINCNTSHQIPVRVIEAETTPPYRRRPRHVSAITDVRFGSLADIEPHPVDVCFPPKSGHYLSRLGCRLCAKSRHQPTYLIALAELLETSSPSVFAGSHFSITNRALICA